ncbi:MAG TPA: SpoIIE family protein phosphatase, partial [Saprospiraceae bacterium]|nr:SpoIIE family protein phosphatase [Saprospiraceae bacterium]
GCSFIGAFEKLEQIQEKVIHLDSEAMIVCFTDGLPDLKNYSDEYFGDATLESFVNNNYLLSPAVFNTKLLDEMDTFRGDNRIEDDIAVLTCKIY